MTESVLARYPTVRGNAKAMAMLCVITHNKDLHEDALALGMAAIAQAPDDMEVRDMVRGALSKGVPTFHVPMLQDEARNQAYVRAIEGAVRPGMTVLEIGTGAGLLALLAARAGAHVFTCEADPMIAAAAREIVARNGQSDRIRVIAKQSDALEIGVDLPAPADLLIHEIFGDTLFGEGVVESLTDACARLLKPGAPVLPPRAELRCALVRYRTPGVGLAAPIEGFDLSPFDLLRPPNARRITARSKNVDLCSAVQSALHTDFTLAAPFGPDRQTVSLQSAGGRIDAIAQWMRIGFGSEILENDPFSGERSHWVAPLYDLAAPIETREGDWIDVTFRRSGRQLIVSGARRAD